MQERNRTPFIRLKVEKRGSGRLAQPTGQIRAVGAFSLGRNFVSILVDEIGRNWGHRPVVVVDVSSVEIVGNGTSKRAFC
jgi:hypothetical protein